MAGFDTAAAGRPTIVLVVNDPRLLDESYQRFMINRFRELLPYDEVPIKLLIRARGMGAAAREEAEARAVHETPKQRKIAKKLTRVKTKPLKRRR